MRFYDVPVQVQKAVEEKNCRPYVRVSFELDGNSVFIPETDIIECEMTSYIETTGGIVSRGTLVLDNSLQKYSPDVYPALVPGIPVHIWYCFGDNKCPFLRFAMYVNFEGFQAEATGFEEKICTVRLVDLSYRLKKITFKNELSGPQPAIRKAVCDTTVPENSLVHIIAERANLEPDDIACTDLPFRITYHSLSGSVWDELSELAVAYGSNMECGKDTPLEFTHSRLTGGTDDSPCYQLGADDITHYRRFDKYEEYANSIHLKFTKYSETGRTELWHFDEPPVMPGKDNHSCYVFAGTRTIERNDNYEARYTFMKGNRKLPVVYTEDVDDIEAFRKNLIVEQSELSVLKYDSTTSRLKAFIKVKAMAAGALVRNMSINGRAIVAEPNYTFTSRDDDEIRKRGLHPFYITNSFLSDSVLNGETQYQEFAHMILSEKKKLKHSYFIKTNKALVHARAGACMSIDLGSAGCGKPFGAKITELTLRYRKENPFETTLWVDAV